MRLISTSDADCWSCVVVEYTNKLRYLRTASLFASSHLSGICIAGMVPQVCLRQDSMKIYSACDKPHLAQIGKDSLQLA